MVSKRSGTEFTCESLCNCKEHRTTPYGDKILVVCPHKPPYTIDEKGKIEEFKGEKVKFKIPNSTILGCDIYIDIDEEYDGQGIAYAKMAKEVMSDCFDALVHNIPREFVFGK